MHLPAWFAERFRPAPLGERGERAAARHLRRLGYQVVAARHRSHYGEIDLIAIDGKTIAFVEVKTRRSDQHGRPALAVDRTRRQRMTRAALAFMKSRNLLQYPSRFDIVEVVWPQEQRCPTITHHKDAFPAEGRGQFYR